MSENKLESWLQEVIISENLTNYEIQLEGNSNKGDGYLGDIIFLNLSGEDQNGFKKTFDLVLKCSKQSETLRKKAPVEEVFKNEINVYKNILPGLQKYQHGKRNELFDSFAKSYGSFIGDNMEVLVLDNLKKQGFSLWDRTKPLTLKHLSLVLREYGKLHAISIAMQDQDQQKFNQLNNTIIDIWTKMLENVMPTFKNCCDEAYNLIKNEVDDRVADAWKKFADSVEYIFFDLKKNIKNTALTITHGDCWSNNFMFHYSDDHEDNPDKVAMLDWQLSELTTPICDVSYFILASISINDIKHINSILNIYYDSLSQNLQKLGSDPEKLWPKQEFLEDWRKFAKIGLTFIPIVAKANLYDKEEIPDIITGADESECFTSGFNKPIKNQEGFKARMKFLAEFSYNNKII